MLQLADPSAVTRARDPLRLHGPAIEYAVHSRYVTRLHADRVEEGADRGRANLSTEHPNSDDVVKMDAVSTAWQR